MACAILHGRKHSKEQMEMSTLTDLASYDQDVKRGK